MRGQKPTASTKLASRHRPSALKPTPSPRYPPFSATMRPIRKYRPVMMRASTTPPSFSACPSLPHRRAAPGGFLGEAAGRGPDRGGDGQLRAGEAGCEADGPADAGTGAGRLEHDLAGVAAGRQSRQGAVAEPTRRLEGGDLLADGRADQVQRADRADAVRLGPAARLHDNPAHGRPARHGRMV